MAVSFTPTAPLEGTLDIHITDAEYQPLFNKELTNYKNKAQLKGFRKGKTPTEVIKKLYGSAILQEVIEKTLQKQLMDHIRDHKMNVLGQPMGNANQPQISYDITNPSEFRFLFDIGYINEFEIQGLDKTFDLYKVEPDLAKIDEQYENIRKRMGELKEVEGPVHADHLLDISAAELEDGTVKEGGLTTEFSVWLSQLSEEAKNVFIGKSKGDTVDADLRSFHADKDDAFIKSKYLTKAEESDAVPALMRLTINTIKNNEPAEVNTEFFAKAYGADVDTEEKAKAKIKEELETHFLRQAEALLFRDVQDHLLKVNKMEMPDPFLKRWLKSQNPSLTDETVEADYPSFTENLLWTLMRDKLVEKYDIRISAQEIRQRMRNQFMSYLGGMSYYGDMSFLDNIINKQMQNREQVEKLHDEIMTDRLFDNIKAEVKLEDKNISEADFESLMEAARKDSAERKKKAGQHLEHHHHDHEHDHEHEHHHHDHDHQHDHHH